MTVRRLPGVAELVQMELDKSLKELQKGVKDQVSGPVELQGAPEGSQGPG